MILFRGNHRLFLFSSICVWRSSGMPHRITGFNFSWDENSLGLPIQANFHLNRPSLCIRFLSQKTPTPPFFAGIQQIMCNKSSPSSRLYKSMELFAKKVEAFFGQGCSTSTNVDTLVCYEEE